MGAKWIPFSTEILLRVRLFGMSTSSVSKDKLFLIKSGFIDPKYPDQRFYCWHCALIEGVISSFPQLTNRLDIERIEWERPRKSVIELVGKENQSLPLLILADDPNTFIADKDQILQALAERHGFPKPHP